jgi:tetratricopeptide (TPR) repeat protein
MEEDTDDEQGDQHFEESVSSGYSCDAPTLGVRVSFLDKFIKWCGGRNEFDGLTTRDVCENFVRPMTLGYQCSYCDMMTTLDSPNVGLCECFVSHAWQLLFLDVVKSLKCHFRENMETVIWFDLFSNNQHTKQNEKFLEWCSKKVIATTRRVILVMSPWENLIPLRRTWCLFELYCCANSRSALEVAMCEKQYHAYLYSVRDNSETHVKRLFIAVDFEVSECSIKSDTERIFSVIRREVGFDKANSMIFSLLRGWLTGILSRGANDVNDMEKIAFKSACADIYRMQGDYCRAITLYLSCYRFLQTEEGYENPKASESMCKLAKTYKLAGEFSHAESLYRRCMNRRAAVLGLDHPDTLWAMNKLAGLCTYMGHYKEAERLFVQCLERSRVPTAASCQISIKYACDNNHSLYDLHNLANLYCLEGSFVRAKALHVSCLEGRRLLLGDDDPHTLTSEYKLAVVLASLREYEEALEVQSVCLEKRRARLGEEHPDTLLSMLHLGCIHKGMGNYDKAEEVYSACLRKSKELLGESHSCTIHATSRLACLYQDLGAFERAEPLYSWCVLKTSILNGDHHPMTFQKKQDLADLFTHQGSHDDAKALCILCRSGRQEKLGANHPDTLTSEYKLAVVLASLREYEEALEVQSVCLEKRRARLGEEHPDTLLSMLHLGCIHKGMGNYDEAERSYVRAVNKCSGRLGADHIDTLAAMLTLAKFYESMTKYEAAENLLLQYVEISVRKYGDGHIESCRARRELTGYRERQHASQYDAEVEKHYALQADKMAKRYGENHIETIHALRELAEYRIKHSSSLDQIYKSPSFGIHSSRRGRKIHAKDTDEEEATEGAQNTATAAPPTPLSVGGRTKSWQVMPFVK